MAIATLGRRNFHDASRNVDSFWRDMIAAITQPKPSITAFPTSANRSIIVNEESTVLASFRLQVTRQLTS